METGLYSGAANLRALEGWQRAIAGNLANASTPGFRKVAFTVEGRAALDPAVAARTPADEWLPLGEARRSFAPGEVRSTANPYDLAIRGDGMFGLETPEGGVVYSRDGEFHRDRDDFLVSKQGYRVLGANGPVQLPVDDGPVSISPEGVISQDGEIVNTLAIYEFEDIGKLSAGNGSLFTDPRGEANPRPAENPQVLQGFLEGANVSPLREMVALIQVSRAYENTQKMMQSRDEMNGKAIESLGARA